jgi:hypothetical protein
MKRPNCPNCHAEMLTDPAPRRSPRPSKGEQLTYWLCSWCWKREVVVQPAEQVAP